MKNRTEKYLQVVVLTVFFIAIVSGACTKKNEEEKETIIPEKALISILSDIYLADGVLSLFEIRQQYSKRDSVSNYTDVIKNHGYTKGDVDNTIRYYIMNKPKKLVKIYDLALAQLSEMESKLKDIPDSVIVPLKDQFNLKTSYSLPDINSSEKPGFKFILTPPGSYNLSFTVTVFSDDESINPCFTAILLNSDTTRKEIPESLPIIKYQKNGLPYTYTVSGKVGKNDTMIFKGWFYDFENRPDFGEPHVKIENISFTGTGK